MTADKGCRYSLACKEGAVAPQEVVVTTVKMDPEVRYAMKRLALDKRISLQDAINEALLAYLARNGAPVTPSGGGLLSGE